MVKESGKVGSDRPGKEIPKEYREVAIELVDNQEWRYDANKKGGYPTLFPPDKSQRAVTIPKTPGDVRSFRNWLSTIRRSGGQWPPRR